MTNAYSLTLLVLPVLCNLCMVAGHVLALRSGNVQYVQALVIGFLSGLICCLATNCAALLYWGYSSEALGRILANVIIMIVSCGCYAILLGVVVSSIRIRILDTIARFHEGVDVKWVQQECNVNKAMEMRLARLIYSGHLRKEEDRLYVNRRQLLYIASFFMFFRALVGQSTSPVKPRGKST